jgi:hypothetical protein
MLRTPSKLRIVKLRSEAIGAKAALVVRKLRITEDMRGPDKADAKD